VFFVEEPSATESIKTLWGWSQEWKMCRRSQRHRNGVASVTVQWHLFTVFY